MFSRAVLMPRPPALGCGHPATQCSGSGVCWPSGPPWGWGLSQPWALLTSQVHHILKEKLCEYLTAVIFTASAQHAAVNPGQVGKDRASLLGRRWPGQLGCLRALGVGPRHPPQERVEGLEGARSLVFPGASGVGAEFVLSTEASVREGGFPGLPELEGGGSGGGPGGRAG